MRLGRALLTRQSILMTHAFLWLLLTPAGVTAAYDETKYYVEVEPRRWALVIGNESYQSPLTRLPSSKLDGEKMRDRLEELRFEVDHRPDVKTADEFQEYIREFRSKVSRGDWVIIYFSGHGFSYGAGNYLVPTEMPIPVKQGELPLHAMTVDGLIDAVAKREPGLIMVFIDACRSVGNIVTNADAGAAPPAGGEARSSKAYYQDFARPIFYSTASASVAEGVSATGGAAGDGEDSQGLADGYRAPNLLPLNVNYFIFYPTEPGKVSEGFSASDRLSSFTHFLFNRIGTANQPFLSVFRNVMSDVFRNAKQKPNFYGFSMTDPYFLPSEDYLKEEREAWRGALRTRTFETISGFLYLNSVSIHAAACRQWLDDDQAARYTENSPAAVERAWETEDERRVGILRMKDAPLVFERQLEQSQGQALEQLSNAELGVVTANTAGTELATDRALEFYLNTLSDHKTVVATKELKGLKRPDASAASERIPSGTTLDINKVLRVSETLGYVSATIRGETSPLFIRVQTPEVLFNFLGKPLKEIMVPPRPDSIPYLVDPAPIREAIAELKREGWEITWYSLSTAAVAPGEVGEGQDPRFEQNARLLRLANAEYILKNEGAEGVQITSVPGKDDLSGNGVRVRFFGVKKN